MRILFCIGSPAWSGSARAFAVAARGLAERGHSITVLCPPESVVERHLEFGSYDVLPLEGDGLPVAAALRLRTVLAERFIEAVFVHQDREQMTAALAARWASRSVVLRRVPAATPVALGAAGRLALRFAPTGLVFASDDDRRTAPPVRGARLDPVVVTLGVNAEAYDVVRSANRNGIGVPAQARVLVCVCDGATRVRAAHVLRTMALLAPRHPELHLVMLGAGSADEDLRMHAAALRITRSVSFLGPREDQASILRLAELAWVVANGDDAAYALLDLLALRVPVLAERGSLAQSYVADGIAGVLLPAAEAADSAAAVARLLAHDEQRSTMGSAGRARVARDFTEAAMLDGFERAVAATADRARR